MFSDANAASQPDPEVIKHMSEEDKKYSLVHKPVGARIEVAAAGPLANFIFAIIVFAGLYFTFGQYVPSSQIEMVQPNSPAQSAGLRPGDTIVRVNDAEIKDIRDLNEQINKAEEEIVVEYERDGVMNVVHVMPQVISEQSTRRMIGISLAMHKVQRGFFESWFYALQTTYRLSRDTLISVGEMLIGRRSADGLSGPIGIAKITGRVAAGGIEALIGLMAILSVSLGLINLFPIPMLDGGHLVFYFIEAITGRPVSAKKQEYAFRVGFLILMSLLIFTTLNDLGILSSFHKIIHKLGW